MTKADINFVRSLSSRKERYETGLFVCEGIKMVGEMLASGLKVHKIYATAQAPADIISSEVCETEIISPKEMERISLLKTPSPALALVGIPRRDIQQADPVKSLILSLDDVQDPGNLGTIMRIADWFGIEDIVCSISTVDCFNPKVVQATMGAVARVRVHYTDLAPYLKEKAASGVSVYGTFIDGGNIYDAPLSPAGIILMGSEGQGIGKSSAEAVGCRLRIPSFPKGIPSSESLNVASAAAIVVSEFRRRIGSGSQSL